jgi:CRISPR system Cascade subunit CasD
VTGLLLRLAGPLQSWGERSAFPTERDAAPFPTRSGLIGMFCAAEGLSRGTVPEHYGNLEFTVRIDRPGVPWSDYHTAGGGFPDELTPATSGGKHKGSAVVTRRHYLADAVFVVAVTGPEDVITRISTKLQRPYWAPYLGRRACTPNEPLLLRKHVEDPLHELKHRVPLSTTAPRNGQAQRAPDTIPVDFVWERYPGTLPEEAVTLTSYDIPNSFAQQERSHSKRTIHRTTERLPASLAGDSTSPLHKRLIAYVSEKETAA